MSVLMAFRSVLRRVAPFILLFLAAQTAIRLGLMLVSSGSLHGLTEHLAPLLTGFWFDLVVVLLALPAILLFPLVLPQRFAGGLIDRTVAIGFFAFLAMLMAFQACSEYFFWEEFTTRFNFIAVDYLIYTQEVLANIFQSYPVKTLLSVVFAAGLMLAYTMRNSIFQRLQPHPPFFARLGAFALFALIGGGTWAVTSKSMVDFIPNETARELGYNGPYNFVHAFFNNEIEFAKFYPTIEDSESTRLTALHFSGITGNQQSAIEHQVVSPQPFKRKNVIQVTMESMNAAFMTEFGGKDNLTPNLDRLASEGLFLANMRATGTRTVRGLEALSLSVPPTPGQSMIRRPGSDNRFTLGGVFQDAGFDTKFIYGGHGYFDNMNGFYQSNGYGIIDQGDMPASEISFENAWGVSDEDLFEEVIKQADAAQATDRNFFYTVMTTSNHRPFTYPDGKIDIPSPGGRNGAVKYSDYAIGQLVKLASTKPWFKDTVFVFVADHTDSVAGREELDFNRYHIPCIIWSPGFVQPQRVDRMVSQIDMAPTLLGLLDASYTSRFFGTDLLSTDLDTEVYVSNYEKVALVEGDLITVLEPPGISRQYRQGVRIADTGIDHMKAMETIAWYQVASRWRQGSARVPSGIH